MYKQPFRYKVWAVTLLCGFVGQGGCSDFLPPSSSIPAETTITSTSLAGANPSAQLTPPEELPGLQITPENVTGQVLSLLFSTDGQDDEGIVIFGSERPDIAPADSDLIDFNFAEPEPIQSTFQLQPNFVGGQSSQLVMLFGYMDFHFDLDSNPKIVRVALAENDEMLRGDKLLYNTSTATFEWYDLDTATFTSTRPNNPAVIEAINTFTDPIRPNLVFYPINASLLGPVQVNAIDLAAAFMINVTLDFVVIDSITLVGELDQTTVTDEELMIAFDLSQNATDLTPGTPGYGESGFLVAAELNLVTISIQPAP